MSAKSRSFRTVEYSQHKEQPLPLRQLNDNCGYKRAASCTNRCHCPKKSQTKVSLFSWREGDAQQGHNVWHHQAATYTAQTSHNAQGDQIGGESTAQGPENPPRAAGGKYDFVAINGAETATYEDRILSLMPFLIAVYENRRGKHSPIRTKAPWVRGYDATIQTDSMRVAPSASPIARPELIPAPRGII